MVSIRTMYIAQISPSLGWMRNVPARVLYSLESDAYDFANRMKATRNIQYIVSSGKFLEDGAEYYELRDPERDASIVEYSYTPTPKSRL